MCPTAARPNRRKLTQWIPADLDDLIISRAKRMRVTKSDMVRDLISQGLVAETAADFEERVALIVDSLRAILSGTDPQVSRLTDLLLRVMLETNALVRLGQSEESIKRASAYAARNMEIFKSGGQDA